MRIVSGVLWNGDHGEMDVELDETHGEPRLHLDEGTQALWLVHPNGSSACVEIEVGPAGTLVRVRRGQLLRAAGHEIYSMRVDTADLSNESPAKDPTP